MSAAIPCPLPACDWTYLPTLLPAATLAEADGLGAALGVPGEVLRAQWRHNHLQETERALGVHFAEHTTVEWVSGLIAQRDALARILNAWDAYQNAPQGDRYINWRPLIAAIAAAREWVGTDTEGRR